VSKNALIITDGTELIQQAAKLISGMMTDVKVKICSADKFSGTDILPADYFIIGCENPKPDSFSYLEELLYHINLASRKCGLFSIKEKTIKYLLKMVKGCEADMCEPLLVVDGNIKAPEIKVWLKDLIAD